MTYNKKLIGPVINFVVWLVVFSIICIIGITNVFAATYDPTTFTAQLYDNYGPSLHTVSTEFSNMSWRGTIPQMNANTSGAAWGISSPIPLLKGHTYSMTIRIDGTYGGNIVLSSFNRIGVGTSLANAKSSYENNTNSTLEYSNVISSNSTIQFAFTSSINANYIVFPFATNYTGSNQSFYLYNLIIEDLGSSSNVSQTTINNSLNNQTTEINTSITNSENNIKNTIKDTENNIKDGIKDGFESCRDSRNLFNLNDKSVVSSRFTVDHDGWITIDYDNSSGTDIVYFNYFTKISNLLKTNTNYAVFTEIKSVTGTGGLTVVSGNSWDQSKTNIYYLFSKLSSGEIKKSIFTTKEDFSSASFMIRSYVYFNPGTSGSITFRISVVEDTSMTVDSFSYEKYGEKVCTNRIDDTNKKLDEQNETSKGIFGKIKDLFNWLTNKDDADVSAAGNVAGWLPAGPVDSLITLPLTFLTNVNTSLSKTCSPLNVNLPYVNKSVEIPCLNTIFNQITGVNDFWTWVGAISSVVILFRYLLALYDYFDRLTTLQANFISDWGGV